MLNIIYNNIYAKHDITASISFSKRYDRTNQNRPLYNKQLYEKTGNPLQDRRQSHNSPRMKTHHTDKNRTNFTKTYSQEAGEP
jgi:hypothetical protein